MDAILDAASAILVEDGLAGLTMDAIVKRSGTSKSSLYHFFRDIGCVMDALLDRHALAVSTINENLLAETVDWGSQSLEETVRRFMNPMIDYVEAHPDFLLVIRATRPRSDQKLCCSGAETLMIDRAEQMIAARTPSTPPSERRARATMMFATMVGAMEMSERTQLPSRTSLLREAYKVLVAYLAAADAEEAAA